MEKLDCYTFSRREMTAIYILLSSIKKPRKVMWDFIHRNYGVDNPQVHRAMDVFEEILIRFCVEFNKGPGADEEIY